MPIGEYVVKVHSRCNLACDHCYVYEHADQSWRGKPRLMLQETADQAAWRMAEHASRHRLPSVRVVLHGGEPLLPGRARLRGILTALRDQVARVARLDIRVHTNGVLLDEPLCDLFSEFDVKIGISLDGHKAANDLHRRFPDGRSSDWEVRRALALLRRANYRHLYAGILCTIDLKNDPDAVYDGLMAEEPPRLDLLLPHATWDHPPPRPAGKSTPYASWLGVIYRRWTSDGRPVPIRLFDSILSAARGGPSRSEAVGLDPVGLLVVETDGSWEQADSLKTAYEGAPATGYDVWSHSVDEVTHHSGVAARLAGFDALSPTCQACELVRTCGGGLYAHRYRRGSGFNNPSVYCPDLKVLINRLTTRARTHLTLPEGVLGSLAAGAGDGVSLSGLAKTRLLVTRALVAKVANRIRSSEHVAAAGWKLLTWIDVEHPNALSEVLAHPFVRTWAVRCLRPPMDADPELDRAHLAGIAAAAALRAGVVAELALPVREGALHLPGFGTLPTGAEAGSEVMVVTDPVKLCGWRAVRQVPPFTVDDIDPFRPGTDTLTQDSWARWSAGLGAAGKRLASRLPAYARALETALWIVVPMAAGRPRSRRTFGAAALVLPQNSQDLEIALLTELQWAKLMAMAELAEFAHPGHKPALTRLGDLYARLPVAELLQSYGAPSRFEAARTAILRSADDLALSGSLTETGYRFLDGIRTTADSWV